MSLGAFLMAAGSGVTMLLTRGGDVVDDGLGTITTYRGFRAGIFGSLGAPATFGGAPITDIYTASNNHGPEIGFSVVMTGTLSQSHFSLIETSVGVFETAAASFFTFGGSTLWSWGSGSHFSATGTEDITLR